MYDPYGVHTMQRQLQSTADRDKRSRFSVHQTFMNRMSGDPKWATRRGVYRPGMDDSTGGDGAAPTMGEAPVLETPEYDEDKVSRLTQKRAAPGVRRLRETTQQAMSATYDNPNVKRMTVRDALAGYGTGLENVMSGAGTTARAEYGQEYAADVAGAMATFRGQLDRRSQEFDTQSRDYLMGRQNEYWKEREDYADPYSAFESFYGGSTRGISSTTGYGGTTGRGSRIPPTVDGRSPNHKDFTGARSNTPVVGAGVGWD